MRQKLCVALAVVAVALSGAREATEQFRQLKSLAARWASTNAWNSLLVYAAGTFDGLAPQRQTALVASNSAPRGDAKAAAKRRTVRSVARRPSRVKADEPVIAELALGHAGVATRRVEVEEFRIEVARDGAKTALLVPRFAAADFETEIARESNAAREQPELGMPKLFGKDFIFRLRQAETTKGRAALRRPASRRRVDEHRGETATDGERDAEAQDVLFAAPSDSGLLNCDDEPRR